MKISTIFAAGALLALSYGAVLAQGTSTDNPRGFYVGGGFGQFNVKVNSPSNVFSTIGNFDDSDTAWTLFTGYRFNQFFSVEAAYVDFGSPEDRFTATGSSGDYSVELNGFAPSVVATYPIGPVEIFAKLGYLFYDLNVRADLDNLGGNVFRSDDSGEDVVIGGGVGMTFVERLNVRAEYQKVDVDGTDDANALWLTSSWRF